MPNVLSTEAVVLLKIQGKCMQHLDEKANLLVGVGDLRMESALGVLGNFYKTWQWLCHFPKCIVV